VIAVDTVQIPGWLWTVFGVAVVHALYVIVSVEILKTKMTLLHGLFEKWSQSAMDHRSDLEALRRDLDLLKFTVASMRENQSAEKHRG